MSFGANWDSRLSGFPKQNLPTGGSTEPKAICGSARVPGQSADRRCVVFVCIGIVIGIAGMEEIVPIHDVRHIDVTIVSKIGIQRETEHPVVTPLADFVMDVEQKRVIGIASILEPDLARSLPHIHTPVGFKCDSDGVGPWSRNCSFSKPGRHRRCEEITPQDKAPCHHRQPNERAHLSHSQSAGSDRSLDAARPDYKKIKGFPQHH